jgi:hypothetical protein
MRMACHASCCCSAIQLVSNLHLADVVDAFAASLGQLQLLLLLLLLL